MQGMDHSGMDHSGMNHLGMNHSGMNAAEMWFMRQASGTAFNPASWQMPMIMTKAGSWNLMWMGQAFINATQQSGPRGGDKVYSTNWFMLGATHSVGGGAVLFRSMLSLEPATVTSERYPLLFQTGETAYGKAIVDGQHPHELFMELGMGYAHPVGEKVLATIYFAPVGDVALGPVAYPHRASAAELPQATLSHHWVDSTHIGNEVLTGGITAGKVRLEVSGFHGAEPDEHRWNIDHGAIDSWSSRLSYAPGNNWLGQVSVGRLHNPEADHEGDVVRATASVQYTRPRPGSSWSSTLVVARNYKASEKTATYAVLAESVMPIRRKNFITGRFEWTQRDELIHDGPIYNIGAYTAGYTRDIGIFHNIQTGIGMNLTAYTLPNSLTARYGDHPFGVNMFLRLRLRKSE
jgi:hypothetical protein